MVRRGSQPFHSGQFAEIDRSGGASHSARGAMAPGRQRRMQSMKLKKLLALALMLTLVLSSMSFFALAEETAEPVAEPAAQTRCV